MYSHSLPGIHSDILSGILSDIVFWSGEPQTAVEFAILFGAGKAPISDCLSEAGKETREMEGRRKEQGRKKEGRSWRDVLL